MLKKRYKIAVVVMAIVAVAIGATYAWFTHEETSVHTFKMGELVLRADFDEIALDAYYEPGVPVRTEGNLKNIGNVPALVEFGNEIEIKYSYNNFYETLGGDYITVDYKGALVTDEDGQPNVIDYDEKGHAIFERADLYMPQFDDEGAIISYWLYEVDTPENIYLLLEPGAQIDMGIVMNPNGELIDSDFMNAQLRVTSLFNGTQVLDDATAAYFGITLDDLDFYFGPLDTFGVSSYSTSNSDIAIDYDEIMAHARSLFYR